MLYRRAIRLTGMSPSSPADKSMTSVLACLTVCYLICWKVFRSMDHARIWVWILDFYRLRYFEQTAARAIILVSQRLLSLAGLLRPLPSCSCCLLCLLFLPTEILRGIPLLPFPFPNPFWKGVRRRCADSALWWFACLWKFEWVVIVTNWRRGTISNRVSSGTPQIPVARLPRWRGRVEDQFSTFSHRWHCRRA